MRKVDGPVRIVWAGSDIKNQITISGKSLVVGRLRRVRVGLATPIRRFANSSSLMKVRPTSPLIFIGQGFQAAGAVSNRPYFHLIDIMPTLLDAAGVDYPKQYQGISFAIGRGEYASVPTRPQSVDAGSSSVLAA